MQCNVELLYRTYRSIQLWLRQLQLIVQPFSKGTSSRNSKLFSRREVKDGVARIAIHDSLSPLNG